MARQQHWWAGAGGQMNVDLNAGRRQPSASQLLATSTSASNLLASSPSASSTSSMPSDSATQVLSKTDFSRAVYCIFGLPVDAVTIDQTVAQIVDAARTRRRCFISTPNLNFLIASLTLPAFRDSVIRSDLSTVDGQPLVWIARALGIPILERVAGSTVFERLRQRPVAAPASRPVTVYFFGGPPGAAAQASQRLNAHGKGAVCVGSSSPGFGSVAEMSSDHVIAAINESQPDFLVVALGAQKGQAWILHNLHRLRSPVISHLGAVVNIVAGSIVRAPSWAQRLGCEWLWRIKEEPMLWRRYANDGFAFLRLIVTRLIPCMLAERFSAPRGKRRLPAGVAVSNLSDTGSSGVCAAGAVTITLSGTWTAPDLDSLRNACERATIAPSDIVVDLKNVQFLDSASIGLLLLLYGHQLGIAAGLRFIQASPGVARLLHLHCADFLLRGLPASTVNPAVMSAGGLI